MAKRVLIIGTNRGIGLELVKNYANQVQIWFQNLINNLTPQLQVISTCVAEDFDIFVEKF